MLAIPLCDGRRPLFCGRIATKGLLQRHTVSHESGTEAPGQGLRRDRRQSIAMRDLASGGFFAR